MPFFIQSPYIKRIEPILSSSYFIIANRMHEEQEKESCYTVFVGWPIKVRAVALGSCGCVGYFCLNWPLAQATNELVNVRVIRVPDGFSVAKKANFAFVKKGNFVDKLKYFHVVGNDNGC